MVDGTASVWHYELLFLESNSLLVTSLFAKVPSCCCSGLLSKRTGFTKVLLNGEELTWQPMVLTRNSHWCNDTLRYRQTYIYIYICMSHYKDKIKNNKYILFWPLGDNVS